MSNYVLVALDMVHPQFYRERDGVKSCVPFLADATLFDSDQGANHKRQAIGAEGGRNIPPFEVIL